MKKKFFSLILFVFLIISVFSVTSVAAASEIIDSADITVTINTDGTASVTETWTVSYISASDTFYRNFDVYSASGSMTLLENYDEITDISVKIDGNSIIEADNGINTYSVTESAETIEIAVNCPSSQMTREYQIDYTLTGAVKKVGGKACFSAMILGDTFVYTSNNVAVNVIFPQGTSDVRLPDGVEAVIEGNKASFMTKRVFDTLSVEVSADDSMFESDALVKYSQAKDSLHKAGNFLSGIILWIVVIVCIIAVIVFVLLPDRLIRLPYEKNAKKIMKSEKADSHKLSDSITPCTAYKMLEPVSRIGPKSASKKVPALFGMAILECIDMGYIIPDGNELIVGTPSENVPAYIASVLNFLKTFCDKKGNKYVIDESFAEKVTNECMTRYDVVANYLATFYTLIPSVSLRKEKNKEIYENAFIIKQIITEEKNKNDFARCIGLVLSGSKTRDIAVFGMLFNSVNEKTFTVSGRTGEQALCKALLQMYKVFVKSK